MVAVQKQGAPAQLVHLLVEHAAEALARYDLPVVQLHLVVQPLPHLRIRDHNSGQVREVTSVKKLANVRPSFLRHVNAAHIPY